MRWCSSCGFSIIPRIVGCGPTVKTQKSALLLYVGRTAGSYDAADKSPKRGLNIRVFCMAGASNRVGWAPCFRSPHLVNCSSHAFFIVDSANPPSMAVTCEPYKKTFKTDESLQRHVQDSPRHKHNQYCEVCDRYFNRVDSLQQHLQESKAHKNVAAAAAEATTTNNTPLDEFFLSFQTFEYDPSLSPAKSYSLLRRHMAWSRESPEGKEAWERYREALVDEVRVWFGNENDIAAWNTLCRAIGVQQPPETIDACVGVCFQSICRRDPLQLTHYHYPGHSKHPCQYR